MIEKVHFHAVAEAAGDGFGLFFQVLQDPAVELVALFSHHSVEDRWFDISEDDTVEHFKDAAFNQPQPGDRTGSLFFFEFSQDVGDDHLMGLFVQFRKIHRVDLVIPAADAGGIVDQFQ